MRARLVTVPLATAFVVVSACHVCGFGEAWCDGECVSPQNDDRHCGVCGRACGASSECREGACVPRPIPPPPPVPPAEPPPPPPPVCEAEQCNGLDDDCNGAVDDGATCAPVGHRTYVCSEGTCAARECMVGWGDCDGGDDCETPLDTLDNCGVCGRRCPTVAHSTPWCISYECFPVCDANYADCNDDPRDGCEAHLYALETCRSCDVRCAGGRTPPRCMDSGCVLDCEPGTASCDGDPSNGCEATLGTAERCGSCTDRCGARATCRAGVCEDSTATEVRLGRGHACLRTDDGRVACWGANGTGELGDGGLIPRLSPAFVALPVAAVAMDIGSQHTCVASPMGALRCWGSNGSWELGTSDEPAAFEPLVVMGVGGVVGIGAGQNHTCVVIGSGFVACWGANGRGQLGDGTTTRRALPDVVEALDDAVQVASGYEFSCALRETSAVDCWGANDVGQLGLTGSTDYRTTPVTVDTFEGASSIAAGQGHACVVTPTALLCWGSNVDGQLGNGGAGLVLPRPVIVRVPGTVVEVAAGTDHTCARNDAGEVYCWGRNDRGSVGDGSTSTVVFSPVLVSLPSRATAVGAGLDATCAVLETGDVHCWGRNEDGQLGDGSRIDQRAPVRARW
ncbi:MAG: hypothetical protein IT379_05790 [Deltaproteobacteria bacterium]|nr:hypothetical protein [Deltaproteobacteria bacterium]